MKSNKITELRLLSTRANEVLLSLALIVCSISACDRDSAAYESGRRDARNDVAKGDLKLASWDGAAHPPWFAEYSSLLEQKYKIRAFTYSLPLHPEAAKKRALGYNSISLGQIHQLFGTDVLSRTMAEAENSYRSRHR